MPRLSEIQDLIEGTNLTPELDPTQIEITGGYAGDMLSDVMGSAKSGQAWITIMKHLNIVAVASLVGIPVIILAKNNIPEANVLEKAISEQICILTTEKDTFTISGILYQLLHPVS
jgi:hypothetical protein